MAQSRGFPVKRPAGFHWDFFLLGCTTFVAGILGLPAPNGLVPQAPVHTEALCVTKMVPEDTLLSEGGFFEGDGSSLKREASAEADSSTPRRRMKVVRTRVVEQRVSHLVMGVSRHELAACDDVGLIPLFDRAAPHARHHVETTSCCTVGQISSNSSGKLLRLHVAAGTVSGDMLTLLFRTLTTP